MTDIKVTWTRQRQLWSKEKIV